MSSTPASSKKPGTPGSKSGRKEYEVPQGNEELAALMTSPKGIAFAVIMCIVITALSVFIFNNFGQTAITAWAVFIVCFLFAIRHFIGNAETKLSKTL